jgi:hypothetical protein
MLDWRLGAGRKRRPLFKDRHPLEAPGIGLARIATRRGLLDSGPITVDCPIICRGILAN